MTSRWTAKRLARYGSGVVFLALVASGALSLATSSSAHAAVSPGQGSSSAQLVQVTPHEGSLAVGAIMGEALAGHTANYARAQSQGLDLGAVGTALKGYNCGTVTYPLANSVPTALEVETPANGGSAQKSIGTQQNYYMQDFGNGSASNPPPAPTYGWTEQGLASGVPYAEANTSFIEALANGPLSISGMASKAWSGVVNGQREAGATADIGAITLGSGATSVSLKGLHWEAIYPSGGSGQPSGQFTLGKLVIAGVAVPTNSIALIQKALNTALAPVGVELVLPTIYTLNGTLNVSPLELEVVPASTRDSVVKPILGGLQPVSSPLFNGLETGFGSWEPSSIASVLCQSDTPITVLDITLAAISGGGFTNLAFGGVSASSAALPPNPYHFSLGSGFSVSPPRTQLVAGTAPIAGTPGTPGTPGTLSGTPSASGTPGGVHNGPTSGSTPSQAQAVSPASSSFAAGGPLLAVGLGGLGLLLLLAEGDRRMMRRAQRTIAFED